MTNSGSPPRMVCPTPAYLRRLLPGPAAGGAGPLVRRTRRAPAGEWAAGRAALAVAAAAWLHLRPLMQQCSGDMDVGDGASR